MNKKIQVKNILMLVVVLGFLLAFVLPIIRQGIMCNDELQLRLLRKSGLFEFLKTNFEISASKGRLLGAIFNTKILSYVSSDMYISRIVDCILIIITVIAAMHLIYEVSKEKYFSGFVGLLLLAMLPITYEHTLPNAFISVMCVPMTLLFISIRLLIKAIQLRDKRKNFIISMILLFLALTMYEFAITYAPLYWIVIFVYSEKKGYTFIEHIKNTWKDYLIPFFVCVGYLILYIGSGKFFSSGYSGNTFGFVSIEESMKIIMQLLKSAIPGYYYYNPKYRYLMTIDNGLVSNETVLSIRFLWMLCTFLILIVFLSIHGEKIKEHHLDKLWKRGILLLVGLLAMVLPTLPISISAGYQGAVNADQFIALPVSFCVYFAVIFVIAIVAWEVITRIKLIGLGLVCLSLSMVFSQIQIMNNAFSRVQHEYFVLLESQEKVFETDLIDELEIEKLYASDLFIQHRTLAFHNSYWSELAKIEGVDIQVINEIGAENEWRLYSDENKLITLTNGTILYVLTDELMDGYYLIQINEDVMVNVNLSNGTKDNGKYVYEFEILELNNYITKENE